MAENLQKELHIRELQPIDIAQITQEERARVLLGLPKDFQRVDPISYQDASRRRGKLPIRESQKAPPTPRFTNEVSSQSGDARGVRR